MTTEKNIIQLHTETGTNNYVNKTDWTKKKKASPMKPGNLAEQ